MPTAWNRPREELGLGMHSEDPGDNRLAGSAYLRKLYEGFGSHEFLAAYHAGPVRYQSYVDGGEPLPQSTWEYVVHVRQLACASARPLQSNSQRADSLFVAIEVSNRSTLQAGDVTADRSLENARSNAIFLIERRTANRRDCTVRRNSRFQLGRRNLKGRRNRESKIKGADSRRLQANVCTGFS